MRYARADELELYSSSTTNLCCGFTLVHALSVDEHKHSPARMRYSKFVHYAQNYRHRTDVIVCWVQKFHGFNLAPLCSIRSKVEVNFVDVCGFDACRGSPEL